ncbi:hypothetical protein [Actinacidiphila paucisporea]|uniref:Uncharacterized protein n=1 Tax=Actinacidiphila paucisporea TaxID=310782 RepID=A0A1M7IDP1_9ACTN|nr:hypothetical protein [Actinacidiphila paucisporea]SHM38882.1 hypothetical protein SAMN05216499_110220 [Actinacidiphila paucisporea]
MSENNYRFGDVYGPVNAGDGQQYVAGGDQYIVHGDQFIAGGDQTVDRSDHRQLLFDVSALQELLADLRLTSGERQSAEGDIAGLRDALDRDEPDREQAGRHLREFAAGLHQAGAIASAGTSLMDAAGRIAHWLGPLGLGAMALLGA